jgi:hypothetical protein
LTRAVALVALVWACSVDRAPLDTKLFPCGTDSECGEGWGCVRATPIAPDFCAPLCNGTPCDGICTGGETPQCLRGCRINPDGSTSACPSNDFECVRTSVETSDGICYPVETCEQHGECASNERCLSQFLRDQVASSTTPFDHLYCVPASTSETPCPPGFDMGSEDDPEPSLCLAGCSMSDRRCPPGFACLDVLQYVAPYFSGIDGPVCDIGTFGLSCENDSNCFVGRCLDTTTAQGSVCTLTCNQASARYGGCTNMVSSNSLLGFFGTMECDVDLDPDGGLCVLRYDIGFPGCTIEPGSAYECGAGLYCHTFEFVGGPVNVCTRDCTMDAECNPEGGPNPDEWRYSCIDSRCIFRPGE